MRIFALLLIPLCLAAGCATPPSRSATAGDLVGTWQSFEKGGSESEQGQAKSATVTFGADASVKVQARRMDDTEVEYGGTFLVTPSVIMVNFKEGAVGLEQFPYDLEEDVLTIYDSAADAWLKFRPASK